MKKRTLPGKLMLCLLLISSLSGFAKGQNEEPRTLPNILTELRKKFDVDFVYESNTLPSSKVSINIQSYSSVDAALNDLLKPLDIRFKKVLAKAYVIYKSKEELKKLSEVLELKEQHVAITTTSSETNQAIITGTVIDQLTNLPLEGVAVLVKGTTKGTVTDKNGQFKLDVSDPNATIVISLVGYESKEIKAGSKPGLTVALASKTQALNEVVVVGYGTRTKRDVSSSISSLGGREISKLPVADASQALQGKVAGVTITQNSGAPGGTGGTAIRIRGIGSISGTNNPLIVVDGYPLPDQGSDNILNSFGTADIESIDVLKDAAAAAIYGVRASNGVIMITTKRGKAGKTSLSADMYTGLQEAWSLPSMLNARQYAILNSEARIASGLSILPKLADFNSIENQYGKGTDWLDEIFRRASMQNVNITASGGSDKAQYLFSAGYFRQDGIIYKTDVERFNLRFNGDIKVNDHIKIGNSLSMNKFIEHAANTYDPFNSVVLLALTAPPTVKVRNTDGTYAGGNGADDGFNEPNPIYNLEVPKNKFTKYRINGNIYAEISFLKYFTFRTQFGADFNYSENSNFSPATYSSGGRPIVNTGYFVQKSNNPDYLAEYTLAFNKKFGDQHKVTALVGYTFQENSFSYVNASRGNGTFTPVVPVLSDQVQPITDISQIGNGAADGINTRYISYIARVNYDYAGKGFFSISLRRDGNSNFAPQNKFAYLPAFSAAWRLIEEPFFKKISWLSNLKARASYGFTGNPNVPAYKYLQLINPSFQYTLGNSSSSGGVVTGAAPSSSYNPDIKWELVEQLNLGIDASLFKNKINISLDVYQKKSKDLILQINPPFISGTYESVPVNTGILENKGIDLTINSDIITNRSIRWNLNAVMGTYKNEVVSFGLGSTINKGFSRISGGSLRTEEGYPIDYFYGFVTDGIFQNYGEIAKHAVQTPGNDPTSSTAPGDIRFKDLNNDGVINDQDRTNIGNANPTFTFGLTNTVNYKNFELTVFVQGSVGNKVLNFTRWYTEGGTSNGNYSTDVINRWNGEGSSNSMPRLVLNDPNGNNRVSDRFVEDGSYVRIKNVRLAYTLPSKWTGKLNLKRSQFYLSAQNLATFTSYTGFDPEVGGGVDLGFYPQARTIILGATIDF